MTTDAPLTPFLTELAATPGSALRYLGGVHEALAIVENARIRNPQISARDLVNTLREVYDRTEEHWATIGLLVQSPGVCRCGLAVVFDEHADVRVHARPDGRAGVDSCTEARAEYDRVAGHRADSELAPGPATGA